MNRYYGNTGGRFNSPDKGSLILTKPASLNRYSYAAADPVNFTDATGNFTSPPQCPAGTIPVVDENGRLLYCYLPPIGGGTGGGTGTGGEPEPEPQDSAGPFIPDFRRNIGRYGRFGDAQEFRLVAALQRIWNIGGPGSSCGNFFQSALGGRAGTAALQVVIQNAQWGNAHSAIRPGNTAPIRHQLVDADWADIVAFGSQPPLSAGVTGTVAKAKLNGDVAWLRDDAFNNLDDDQLATLLIHEMLHMGLPGVAGRANIDADIRSNYQQIADACGTKNPLP